ncbi:MAG: hypothetical protein QW238_05130 [Candidatus Bathyarchaeia archaeon]
MKLYMNPRRGETQLKRLCKLMLPILLATTIIMMALTPQAQADQAVSVVLDLDPPVVNVSPCNNFIVTLYISAIDAGGVVRGIASLKWDPNQVELRSLKDIEVNEEIMEGWELRETNVDLEKGIIEAEAQMGEGGEPIKGENVWVANIAFHCVREGRSTIGIQAKLYLAESETPVLVSDSTTVNQRVYAVGGVMTSVDKLSVLAPYLALLGSAGALSFVYVLVRRRRA